MSVAPSISVTADNATDAVAELMRKCAPERLAKILADPLEGFWRDHLKHFPRRAGKYFGMPGTGFGERAAEAVKGTAVGGNIRLVCDAQGIAQRYYGGQIPADGSPKILSFPIASESYGKTIYDFGFVKGQPTAPALRTRLRLLFAIVRGPIKQEGNPNVVPTEDQFQEVGMAAIVRSLEGRPA